MVTVRLSVPTKWARKLPISPSSYQLHCYVNKDVTASMVFRRFASRGVARKMTSLGSQVPPSPELLPPEDPVDEERIPGYSPEHYYPANPGDILGTKYRLEAKVGWGSSSTVWLARDIRRYVNTATARQHRVFASLHPGLRPSQWQLVYDKKACRCEDL